MTAVLTYCRAGFENDAANELMQQASDRGVFGYVNAKKGNGYVLFESYQSEQVEELIEILPIEHLIFSRQWFASKLHLQNLNLQDRVGDIIEAISQDEHFPQCGNVRVEHPDTDSGKELSKFCRKFTVPLRQSLRKHGLLTDKPEKSPNELFVFFTDNQTCFVGYAKTDNCSPLPHGILRLKAAADAPSRSSLKLEEAFQVFIPKIKHEDRLRSGMKAVDLGACPGGWTYQLVRRGMFVQAIDNGLIDESLMQTGQVEHFQVDGFVYEPKKKNVYWLVCDMVEKPMRVSELMADWVAKEWCVEAMFNLKLPMKRRYESLMECLDFIREYLKANGCRKFSLRAKHLYHDREEVTVHIRRHRVG
ncbi:23S rRNA (cytidine(2498)-2'-O)-methyltransferase RlmM [Alteromonas sp. a30]|uniref:23S rRNA (cytidine(2498)-2'-O)-methyltransferase RlmM n=1 Tax=Alteromonas sp. a30 TaxID=2730917 RepID=UPI00227DDA8E|nr:23S rRNA (cytidine(2498)-2'-O)-methyltransferase RlmM [Alteromonas sp. a30]MCY7296980.1 23S rRNA (cytidine(2498)-2'-O)-methyltransferase RlmM [Alteromonas sp. a30]